MAMQVNNRINECAKKSVIINSLPNLQEMPQHKNCNITLPAWRQCINGLLPSSVNGNKYLLTVIDKFSHFLFIFPCKDRTSRTNYFQFLVCLIGPLTSSQRKLKTTCMKKALIHQKQIDTIQKEMRNLMALKGYSGNLTFS